MTVSQEKLEKALAYLSESAKEYAEARGLVVWLEERKGIVRSEAFKQAMAGDCTVAMAEAQARTDPSYAETVDKLRDAVQQEALIRAYRDAAECVIEVWRSENAARRAANV